MKYKLKPTIILDNSIYKNKYDVLITEILVMPLIQLDEILQGIESVFNGKWHSNSFSGNHMAVVDYDTNIAKISYFDDIVGEEPTLDIYNMLKEYRDKILEYENKQNSL